MPVNCDETLLVCADDDGLALSLYLDAEMIERLEAAEPSRWLYGELLDDLCKVIEGISHFNCVAWKATHERPVSLLELELQGEIDKFVAVTLMALTHHHEGIVREMHARLFEQVSYRDDLDLEQLDRYRAANDSAARFCHRLRSRLIDDSTMAFADLRDFYRLQLADKIRLIHYQGCA